MILLLLLHFRALGGPYFEIPRTVYDHVIPGRPPLTRQAIVMSENVAPLLPRGATLTVISPELEPNWDATHYLTASGLLPHQRVMHPAFGPGQQHPDFVIALGRPFSNPEYRLVREFPEGRLYQRYE